MVEVAPKNETDVKEFRGFWLTRIVFLRCLAFIYCVGFSVALFQNKALIGEDGILPVPTFMDRVRTHFHLKPGNVSVEGFMGVPSLFWFVPVEHTDITLDCISTTGLVLSLVVLLQGAGNMFIMFTLWALYHSLVNVGQRWYSFGWESQLLETGFLTIWLVPVYTVNMLPVNTPTSRLCVYGNRWLIFRIMLGAGLIKLRGDQCWRDLTCMNYHYETQPVPNPLSWGLHHMPQGWHMVETMGNHIVELVLPWLLVIPHRSVAAFTGITQLVFQTVIIISGNFSFLNWLTMLPSIFCFDDGYTKILFSKATQQSALVADKLSKSVKFSHKPARYQRAVLNGMIGMLLVFLSIPVIQNLMSSRQQMNTSFDSFRLINTYGAFGSITKERTEIILEGTASSRLEGDTEWREYEFKCKPGSVDRRPCIISPYHYRLDWLMWFAAFQDYHQNPWFINMVAKLLEGDPGVRKLIALDPFQNTTTLPKYIRAKHYLYQYTPLFAETTAYWNRKYLKPYMPPVNLAQLKDYREKSGWLKKEKKKPKSYNYSFPTISYPIVGLILILGIFLVKLFGRELDMYYESSVGTVNTEIDNIMSKATMLDPLDVQKELRVAAKPKSE